MRRKRIVLVSAVLVLVAAGVSAFLLGSWTNKPDQLETVRIGATSAIGGLIYIADEKGFFKKRGVNAVVKTYETGALAVNDLFANSLDMATVSEFMMVRKSFDNDTLRAFAQIANTNRIELVTRKDRGITQLSDLRGKRIGLLRGTNVEYFLSRLLAYNNVPISRVQLVNLAPSATEEALFTGSVDAAVIWEPYVAMIEERLGKNAMRWRIQGRDDYYFLLISTEAFLRRSPATAEKILRALIDAEHFADKHPDEVREVIGSRLKLRPNHVKAELARSRLQVRLDQALLPLMEAEAAWMIRNNLTQKKEIPNYLDMIDLKALETVKPEGVGIIH